MTSRKLSALLALFSFAAVPAQATESPSRIALRVACASDLQAAMTELQETFRKSHPGIEVKVSVGASGTLTSQIEQQAPFDLFFSADSSYPERLAKAGLTQGEPFEYAQGKLSLWISNTVKLTTDPKQAKLKILQDPSIHKIAIGNPAHAPYGKAAVAAMKSERIYESIQGKLVQGENIAQTAHFVETGAADAGLISLSFTRSPALRDRGIAIEVPVQDYPPIKQSAIILKSSSQKDAALKFRSFILGEDGKNILKKYGYSTRG